MRLALKSYTISLFSMLISMNGLASTANSKSTTGLSKEIREAIYFSASLEKEAVKILTKNPNFDELTLFSVLSYAVETVSGIKKKSPSQLDCNRFRFQIKAAAKNITEVYKTCQKPEILIAEINQSLSVSNFSVTFYIKEWTSVVGLAAALSSKNISCDVSLKNKKLRQLNCEDWARTLQVSSISAEELRLKTFRFDREAPQQFILKGGVFKDLVETKKIEVTVPIDGKIKRFEKEVEVIDEFAEKPGALPGSRPARFQVKPVKSIENQGESEIEKNSHNSPPIEGDKNSENGGIPPAGR